LNRYDLNQNKIEIKIFIFPFAVNLDSKRVNKDFR